MDFHRCIFQKEHFPSEKSYFFARRKENFLGDNMASFDVNLEREAISGPSIDYSSFSKALFGSNVEGQQFLSTMKALPLSKCPVNSKKGNFDQLPASYKSWDKLDEKQLGNVQKFWSRLTPEIQDEVRQASVAAESMRKK
jgi:hypothetical protein